MSLVFNPYLPSYEYVPDGEPHLFGDRVYLYGSHDCFNANDFCYNDYICWSCPKGDLSAWRYEGIIWKKDDDPHNKGRKQSLYAPDVCQGPDGRYYMYYFVAYHNRIGVAVCDTPAGHYQFLGYVHHKDGTLLGRKKGDGFAFDPGVYVEGENVYLYTGFGPVHYLFTMGKQSKEGATVCRLEKDMLTIKDEPNIIGKVKRVSKGSEWEGHEFFEAASMRKINGKYYFIYSSFLGHELCYAISDKPDRDFKFGGTIVSIGDVGLGEHKDVKSASNFTGNTHGSILTIDDKHYIFYHRQTNRHCFSRQACVEEIKIEEDGSIKQVEVTSCGLNGGPLPLKGEYGFSIACNLTCPEGGKFYMPIKGPKGKRPYFTQSGKDREDNPDQYIANFHSGDVAGFKYFAAKGDEKKIEILLSGNAQGRILVYGRQKKEPLSSVSLAVEGEERQKVSAPFHIAAGCTPLFFEYEGSGALDLFSFRIG